MDMKLLKQLGDEFKELIIIAVTANAFEEDKIAALKAGMNVHISKPIRPTELHDEILRLKKKIKKHSKIRQFYS